MWGVPSSEIIKECGYRGYFNLLLDFIIKKYSEAYYGGSALKKLSLENKVRIFENSRYSPEKYCDEEELINVVNLIKREDLVPLVSRQPSLLNKINFESQLIYFNHSVYGVENPLQYFKDEKKLINIVEHVEPCILEGIIERSPEILKKLSNERQAVFFENHCKEKHWGFKLEKFCSEEEFIKIADGLSSKALWYIVNYNRTVFNKLNLKQKAKVFEENYDLAKKLCIDMQELDNVADYVSEDVLKSIVKRKTDLNLISYELSSGIYPSKFIENKKIDMPSKMYKAYLKIIFPKLIELTELENCYEEFTRDEEFKETRTFTEEITVDCNFDDWGYPTSTRTETIEKSVDDYVVTVFEKEVDLHEKRKMAKLASLWAEVFLGIIKGDRILELLEKFVKEDKTKRPYQAQIKYNKYIETR